MIKIKLKFYDALCATNIFTINGVDADYEDFGIKYDRDSEKIEYYGCNAEDCVCGDMRFTGMPSTPKILAKYKITEDEYQKVVSKLEDGLSFGCCSLCL